MIKEDIDIENFKVEEERKKLILEKITALSESGIVLKLLQIVDEFGEEIKEENDPSLPGFKSKGPKPKSFLITQEVPKETQSTTEPTQEGFIESPASEPEAQQTSPTSEVTPQPTQNEEVPTEMETKVMGRIERQGTELALFWEKQKVLEVLLLPKNSEFVVADINENLFEELQSQFPMIDEIAKKARAQKKERQKKWKERFKK